MKRKEYNFVIEHEFADGTKMTDEEFMSKPFVVDCALNKQVIEDISVILSSKHQNKIFEKTHKEMIISKQLETL